MTRKNTKVSLRLDADYIARLAIVAVMAAVFLPHVFIATHDINLITAFEVDPGSIFYAIDDLYRPGDSYNMLNGYHSKFYGWSFYAIVFWLYSPFHYIFSLDGIGDNVTRYTLYRFIFLTIGVMGVLSLYTVIRRLAPKLPALFGFAIILVFLFSANVHSYVFVKTDSTGTLFFLLAVWAGWLLLSKNEKRFFYVAVICMSLSALSKQIFFFLNSPLFVFCLFYMQSLHSKPLDFNKLAYWVRLGNDFLKALLLGMAVAFVIHPYAFLDLQKFLTFQSELASNFRGNIGLTASILAWAEILKEEKLYSFIFFYIVPLNSVAFAYSFWSRRDLKYVYFLVLNLCMVLCFFMVGLGNHYLMTIHYLTPILSLLIINQAWFVQYLVCLKWWPVRNVVVASAVLLFGGLGISDWAMHKTVLDTRLNFDESVAYKTYQFISRLPLDADGKLPRIAHDHVVAVPIAHNSSSCHIWRGCGDGDYIEAFKPQYVLIQETVVFGPDAQHNRLLRYVRENDMQQITKIEGTILNLVDVSLRKSNKSVVYVYKSLE